MFAKILSKISLFFVLAGCAGVQTYSTYTSNSTIYRLPKSMLKLEFTEPDTLTATPMTFASSKVQYLQYSPNAFSDDVICIVPGQTGLLRSVYFAAQDRTADVLLNVVQLLAGEFAPEGKNAAAAPTKKVGFIDPSRPATLTAFNKQISPYRIEMDSIPDTSSTFECPADSVCYATKVSVPIKLQKGSELKDVISVDLVDTAHYNSLRVDRAFMTAKVTKLDFQDGVLTGVRIRKDSEALAVSTFPLKVIERILSVPVNAIALAFGTAADREKYKSDKDKLIKVEPNSPQALMDLDKCIPNS
ncbi:hypothetical protein [Rhizobium binae]|uniref:hypothetical protein n=1 Tax=Rhizobium binae TaxID=1138190 RepID=UPI001C831798|nr:hypothetical protein [Rhizobium binae]MBX4962151.1 hypothetical protein [Rhizobium binae]